MSQVPHVAFRPVASRRTILGGFGTITLSAAAIGLLAGCRSSGSAMAASAGEPEQDVGILNVALGLEHEAVAAYGLCAETGLLEPAVLDVALLFQGHHAGHRDALEAAIVMLDGTPVEAASVERYAEKFAGIPLGSQAEILDFARTLELQAANAYLGVIPAFEDGALAKIAARLAADETMHWTVLAQATGAQLPTVPLSFGT